MSTIHGLMKLEIRNCGTANDTPQTRMAGQICQHPAPPGEGPNEPERHDQREEWQLAADHGAKQVGVKPGDAGQAGDRGSERSEGDRGRIGDQR